MSNTSFGLYRLFYGNLEALIQSGLQDITTLNDQIDQVRADLRIAKATHDKAFKAYISSYEDTDVQLEDLQAINNDIATEEAKVDAMLTEMLLRRKMLDRVIDTARSINDIYWQNEQVTESVTESVRQAESAERSVV